MEIGEAAAAVERALDVLVPAEPGVLAGLSEADVAARQAAWARIRRLVDVRGALLAGAVAQRSDGAGGGMARRHGHRNAVGMVAQTTGSSAKDARDLIAAGELLSGGDAPAESGAMAGVIPAPRWSQVAAALRAGTLSAAQAALLKDTLDRLDGADETLEARLVAKAQRLALADLRKACLDVTARWDLDRWEAREKRQRADRYVSVSERADGMVALNGVVDPASGAVIKTWLDAQVRDAFARRRNEGLGPAEPGEAGRIRADALVGLARHGMRCDEPGSGVSTQVVVRVDEPGLRTGLGLGSCDAVSTPMSAGQLRRMAVDAKILPVVLGAGSQALDVGYARRYFTPAQRIALAERDGGCAFCHAPVSWCDAHHIQEWSRGGPSNLANGVLLCTRCHHRIHDDGWTVKATTTEVWFTPPRTIDPKQTPRQGGRAALHVDIGRTGPERARTHEREPAHEPAPGQPRDHREPIPV
ncbi:HNH endonuclease signature motif containing protein [Demequina mangrovi]|uniref:5-methylcytosine-specific restriction enzyme A n=1 Tax=Demequina mangrovi TaxID=1043493 RepID=A0A1H6V4S3_9MICO|nr:HNH endonuclease signature motif containing protein [Demequina mangrovi]SEI95245.1 5-methylcytosine-specific restriction enzyme A [Demequina mangrovi]